MGRMIFVWRLIPVALKQPREHAKIFIIDEKPKNKQLTNSEV